MGQFEVMQAVSLGRKLTVYVKKELKITYPSLTTKLKGEPVIKARPGE